MQFFKIWLTSLDFTNTSNCTIKVKNVLEYWQSVIKVHSWHDYTNDFYDLSSSILHLNNNLKLLRKLITSHFSNNLTSCISTGETSYYTLASSTITSNKKDISHWKSTKMENNNNFELKEAFDLFDADGDGQVCFHTYRPFNLQLV